MEHIKRCRWCNSKNPLYISYHDSEWGKAVFSDAHLYEMLILESFQAGLSWECVLNKREAFRAAYDGFDIDRVCSFGEEKIAALMRNEGIIRNGRKIRASIENSRIFKDIVKEFGSFYEYLSRFTGGRIFYETDLTKSALSDAISRDLERRGMKFVGTTILYAYLQAVGIIVSHEKECFLFKESEE